MSVIQNVALAGANGNIGAQILRALIEHNFTVTVLVRPGSSSTHTYPPEVKVAQVDYARPSTLHSALIDQDAVISAIGDAATLTQEALIDAAIAAGVKRMIPSEYGSDPDHAAVRALPVFVEKQRIAEYVREKTSGNSRTTYSLICCNALLDFELEHAFGVDLKRRTMEIHDGGGGEAYCYADGFCGEEREACQRVLGEEGWEIKHVDTVERDKEGWRALREGPENFMEWAVPFFQVSSCAERFGGDCSLSNDNKLLRLEELTDGDVEAIVGRYA